MNTNVAAPACPSTLHAASSGRGLVARDVASNLGLLSLLLAIGCWA